LFWHLENSITSKSKQFIKFNSQIQYKNKKFNYQNKKCLKYIYKKYTISINNKYGMQYLAYSGSTIPVNVIVIEMWFHVIVIIQSWLYIAQSCLGMASWVWLVIHFFFSFFFRILSISGYFHNSNGRSHGNHNLDQIRSRGSPQHNICVPQYMQHWNRRHAAVCLISCLL
jgi:hypothetical protein